MCISTYLGDGDARGLAQHIRCDSLEREAELLRHESGAGDARNVLERGGAVGRG